MHKAMLKQASFAVFETPAAGVVPGQVSDSVNQAVNDDIYLDGSSCPKMALSVLANAVGGSLLLSGMFFLPHLIAGILG